VFGPVCEMMFVPVQVRRLALGLAGGQLGAFVAALRRWCTCLLRVVGEQVEASLVRLSDCDRRRRDQVVEASSAQAVRESVDSHVVIGTGVIVLTQLLSSPGRFPPVTVSKSTTRT